MMKRKIWLMVCFVAFFANAGHAQDFRFDSLLNSGKIEFKKDTGNDYALAIHYLKQAVLIQPENAEAHYYLAYAYSRYNSSDGTTIPAMKLPLVFKTSEQLEKVIKISPEYKGEIIVLDPYSKLSSEWGAMTTCYLSRNKTDSAVWALKEGKKRGGFDDFILSENRLILKSCSPNAILISSGDNFFFPFLYLQNVEGLRKDVSVVDIGMIGSDWYPDYLVSNSNIKFDVGKTQLDTLSYREWSDSTISIPVYGTNEVFKWVVKPTYEKQYILRPDRLLISLLKENKFKRDVYFTKGFETDDEVSLADTLMDFPLLQKLSVHNEQTWNTAQTIEHMKQWSLELKPANKYSPFEAYPIDHIRNNVLKLASKAIDDGHKNEAVALINALDTYLPESIYPTSMDDFDKNRDSIRTEAN